MVSAIQRILYAAENTMAILAGAQAMVKQKTKQDHLSPIPEMVEEIFELETQ